MALVALRLVIGWHFFSEGLSHYAERGWSSEGFLRSAKGPLKPMYRSLLPDEYRWDEYMYSTPSAGPGIPEWTDQVKDDWHNYRIAFVRHYGLDKAQKDETPEQKKAREQQKNDTIEVLKRARQQLDAWVAANTGAIGENRHVLDRLRAAEGQAGAEEVPFQRTRIKERESEFRSQIAPLIAGVQGIEKDYRGELLSLLTPEQRKRGSLPRYSSRLEEMDKTLKYVLLGVGGCLIVGLFTRTAAVVGAGFLLSVVLAQPFWLPDTIPTYNQFVELVALLALATTHVGRWGGLDYFIHHLIVEPARSAKVSKQEPELY